MPLLHTVYAYNCGPRMALTSGTRLGPYEIESLLGAGGMGGSIALATRDGTHGSDQSIERSTGGLALNCAHASNVKPKSSPSFNIPISACCTMSAKRAPIDYLVMEFLQGESLAERLRKGPLAPDRVWTIAIEIADALEKRIAPEWCIGNLNRAT